MTKPKSTNKTDEGETQRSFRGTIRDISRVIRPDAGHVIRSKATADEQPSSSNGGVHDLAVSAIAPTIDLWGLAYQQLCNEKETLMTAYSHILSDTTGVSDVKGIEEQAQAVLALKREQILQKQWKLQWGSKSILVRTQIDRIVKLIGVFKDLGSSIAGLDPVHAGLPWAGICFWVYVSLLPLL